MYKIKSILGLILIVLLQFVSIVKLNAQLQEVYSGQLNDSINLEMFGTTRLLQAGSGEVLFLVNANDDIIIYKINSKEILTEFNFEGHINCGTSLENGDVIFCGSNDISDGVIKIYTPSGSIRDSLIINNDVPMSILSENNIFYFGTSNGVIYTCDNMLNIFKITKVHTSSIYDLVLIGSEEIAILTATEIYTFRVNTKFSLQTIYACDTCSFFRLFYHDQKLYFASKNNLFNCSVIDKSSKVISMNEGDLLDFFLNEHKDKLYTITENGNLSEFNISDLTLLKSTNLLASQEKVVKDSALTSNTENENIQFLSFVLSENLSDYKVIDTLTASKSDAFYVEIIDEKKVLIAQTSGKFTIFNLLAKQSIQYQSKVNSINSMYLSSDKEYFLVTMDNTGWNYIQQPEFKSIAASRSSHNVISIIRTFDGKHTVGYYYDNINDFYQFDVKKLIFDSKKDINFNVTYINDFVITSKFSTSKSYPLLILQANGFFRVYDKAFKIADSIDSITSYANVENSNTVFLLKQDGKLISKTLGKEDEKFVIDLSNLAYNQELMDFNPKIEISDNGLYLAILFFDRFYILDLRTKNLRNSVFVDKYNTVSDFEINNNGRLIYSVINSLETPHLNSPNCCIRTLPEINFIGSYFDEISHTIYLIDYTGLIYSYILK